MRRSFLATQGIASAAIAVWLVSEIVVFVLVVQAVGFGPALLVGLAAFLLGLTILRRIGFNAVRNLRRSIGGKQPTADAMLDGSLAAIGAVLLIVPGFITDLVGLALAAPSIRQWLAHRFAAVPRPGHGSQRERLRTIELAPEDWRRLEEAKSWSETGPDRPRRS